MRFDRLTACAILSIALLAAGSCSGDGSTGPQPRDFKGAWVLRTERGEAPGGFACFGFAGPAERFFTIETDPISSSTLNVVAEWDFVKPYRDYHWSVTGNINTKSRAVTLNFWHTPLQIGAEFTGTIAADGTIAGELRDPKPGYQPHTVTGVCYFNGRLERDN